MRLADRFVQPQADAACTPGRLLWQHLTDLPQVADKLVGIATGARSYWYSRSDATYTGAKIKADSAPASAASFQRQVGGGRRPLWIGPRLSLDTAAAMHQKR